MDGEAAASSKPDQTITTFLMFKGIFNLTLWAAQGLLDSLFKLAVMRTGLKQYQQVSTYGDSGLSTAPKGTHYRPGLRLNRAEGEWKVRKQGAKKWRVWLKLHLAVDPVTHDIVAAEVSPTLLNPLRRKLGHILCGWSPYDSKASHQLISRKGATACIPPRKLCAGDAQGRAGALEEDIGGSPSLAG